MKILYLIPARGGSKRLPGKNSKPLLGKPLIHYSIEYARQFNNGEDIWVSTEDENISKICGNCCVLKRPIELASDNTRMEDVIMHAVKSLPGYDTVVLLQPTSPFRRIQHLHEALANYDYSDCELLKSEDEQGDLNGSIYIFKVSALGKSEPITRYYQMDNFYSVDINTPFDWFVAEAVGNYLNKQEIIWGGCEVPA